MYDAEASCGRSCVLWVGYLGGYAQSAGLELDGEDPGPEIGRVNCGDGRGVAVHGGRCVLIELGVWRRSGGVG